MVIDTEANPSSSPNLDWERPSLEACLGGVDGEIRAILERALEGREIRWQEGVTLSGARGRALHALCLAADTLREQQAGEPVTYVVNRNVNFTNVCVKACRFCAFSRTQRSEEGYFLGDEEIVRRAVEARDLGATEVCIQAGLAPGMDPKIYVRLVRAIRAAAPELHLHAFSPEEIKFGAGLAGVPFRAFLEELKDAGLGSLPGTSAEVLDDAVRAKISPGRITTAEWIDVIRTAHAIGLPTTSTLMFGHIETAEQRMRHLDLLRSIQRETGGFTEFVPLSFVHHEAPMFAKGLVGGGPTGDDVLRLYAIARVLLGPTFRNIQVSWVKEGMRNAQWILSAGANDLGGTLMNESISTAAGAANGQVMAPSALRRYIRDAGRTPAERDTKYRIRRTFAQALGPEGEPREPLDGVQDPEKLFGTYKALTQDGRYRFHLVKEARAMSSALTARQSG